MLRKLTVNRRSIPVPVPLQTLGEVIQWIGETLVLPGHSITRITLNAEDIEFSNDGGRLIASSDVLEIRIDSPADLGIQALEAITNLAAVVSRGLKPLAVKAWESTGPKAPEPLVSIHDDLELIMQLVEHFSGLVFHRDLNAKIFTCLERDFGQLIKALALARSNSDWRGYARLLLNRVEPLLQDLSSECETLESQLIAMRTDARFAQAQ